MCQWSGGDVSTVSLMCPIWSKGHQGTCTVRRLRRYIPTYLQPRRYSKRVSPGIYGGNNHGINDDGGLAVIDRISREGAPSCLSLRNT